MRATKKGWPGVALVGWLLAALAVVAVPAGASLPKSATVADFSAFAPAPASPAILARPSETKAAPARAGAFELDLARALAGAAAWSCGLRAENSRLGDFSWCLRLQVQQNQWFSRKPASVAKERGNLTQFGAQTFVWDGLNRLKEVKEGATVKAAFEYDYFNRRVSRTIGAERFEIVWDGWQPVEEYRVSGANRSLVSRRIYGPGIDEIIQLEQALDASGTLTAYTPLYDTVGNLVVLADSTGKPVERYEYTPYGERFQWSDLTPPAVEQVLFRGGSIELELSEEVTEESITRLRNQIALVNLVDNQPLAFELSKANVTGRQAGQRLKITSQGPPPPAEGQPPAQVRVTVPVGALTDFFANQGSGQVEQIFTWNGVDQVVQDAVAPRLGEACVTGGKVRLEFSERVSVASLAASVLVDGAATTWTALGDGYTYEAAASTANGFHSLSLGAGVVDLAGLALPAASFDFTVANSVATIYQGLFPGETANSVAQNRFGWKGLEHEPSLGLVYVRNRWYSPELGRFISADPMGYVDGPSMYAFGLNNPVSNSDPMGLFNDGSLEKFTPAPGSDALQEKIVGFLANPYVQGPLLIIGGCSEAGLGAASAAASGGLAAVPGFAAMVHGSDVCGTGIVMIVTGENQSTLTYKLAASSLNTVGFTPEASRFGATVIDGSLGIYGSMGSARALVAGVPITQGFTKQPYVTQNLDFQYIGEQFGEVFETPVRYLDDAQRSAYLVTIENGRVVSSAGKLYSTRAASSVHSGAGKAIYVMDDLGRIYISNFQEVGIFHHSSFLAGQPVAAAGEISIAQGRIIFINRTSGHYKPLPGHLQQAIDELTLKGADLSKTKVDFDLD